MSKKWTDRTLAAIESGSVEEGKIRSMRRIMARAINNGQASWMTGSPQCDAEQAARIMEAIEEKRPRVTQEQADKGATWLRKNIFRKDGAQRSTKFAQQFTPHDLHVIANLDYFELVEFYDTQQNGDRYCTLFPVYRAVATDGAFFDYVARAWQSGGNSFVTNRGGFR